MTENQAPQSEAALARLCEAALEGLQDLAAGLVLEEAALDEALQDRRQALRLGLSS